MASAMRRLITSLMALCLAAAAFALAACGGDDNKTTSGQPTLTVQQPGTETPTGPTAGGTTDQTGGKKKSKRSRRRSSGSNGSNAGSTEPQQPKKKSKKEKLSPALAEALSKKGEDKVSYEAARQVCRERPLKEIRQTYKVKKKGNEAIADKVGRTYYPKHRAEAGKAGCLKGLSER
jgi:hypothetical protein